MFHTNTIDTIPYSGSVALAGHNANGCASCDSTTGPFVPGTTTNGDPLHLCKTCVGVAAATLGYMAPDQVARLEGVCQEIHEHAEQLAHQLEQAKQNAVVPLADVIDFLEERAKRRPEAEPVKAGA